MGKLKNHYAFPNARDRTMQANMALADRYFAVHKDKIYQPVTHKYVLEGDRVEEVKELVVHQFSMGDVEDPDLYAAQPLSEWENSDFGQWVMKNACDVPTWHRMADMQMYGYRYQIRAKFKGPVLTQMLLKYGNKI